MKTKLLFVTLTLLSFKIAAQEDEGLDFALVDIPPITSDCNPNLNNEELKFCFTKSITNQIVSKINPDILQSQGLKAGMYKINAYFTINKKGKVKNVRADFQNDLIIKEIIQAVIAIKQMTPAYLDEKPVSVNYVIPIKFRVN